MQLQNNHSHMRNQSVKVDGTVYTINGEGVTEDITNPSDLKKLLLDRSSWRKYFPAPEVEEQKKANNETVPEAEVVPESPMETEPEKVDDTNAQHDEGIDYKNDTDQEVEDETGSDEVADAEIDRQYPDPTMENTAKELKELADVYEVSYKDQPKKEVLIKRIMDAMYPEE